MNNLDHRTNGDEGIENAPDTGTPSESFQQSERVSGARDSIRAEWDPKESNPSPVTRNDAGKKPGLDKRKTLLLGGGLLAAVLFFVFTAMLGKHPSNTSRPQTSTPSQQKLAQPKGSVTPLTEAVHKPSADDSTGQLSPSDIKRTRTNDWNQAKSPASANGPRSTKPSTASGDSLASVPSFADTQQKWEEPKPYAPAGETPQTQTQQQGALKEASLIFVKSQTEKATGPAARVNQAELEQPPLQITPGTRIQAKLETQISSAVSAPVVAVIEYTYAIGDQIVIPAGARVYGQLRQADRSGYVDVKFDEIELLDGAREKIDAIGAGLDLGPIKGAVFGKNTGKNFLIRTVSGLGSVAAMIVGNNNSSAFSEDDLIRQRVAENVGTAGDTQLMSLNANSRIVVSVPADTKIYVVFTKHEQTPSTLQKAVAAGQ